MKTCVAASINFVYEITRKERYATQEIAVKMFFFFFGLILPYSIIMIMINCSWTNDSYMMAGSNLNMSSCGWVKFTSLLDFVFLFWLCAVFWLYGVLLIIYVLHDI